MATNSTSVDSENSILNFFKKCSPKFTRKNSIEILRVVWWIGAFSYLYSFHPTIALITAIVFCLGHLFIESIVSPKVEKKFRVLLKRFTVLIERMEAKLFQEKTDDEQLNRLKRAEEEWNQLRKGRYDLKRAAEERDQIREQVSNRYCEEIRKLNTQAIKMEERSVKFMSDLSNHLKIVEEERKDVSQLEKKCSDLMVELESERAIYKIWRDESNSIRKQLEHDKESLKVERDGEMLINMRLQYQVEKLEELKEKYKTDFELEKMKNEELQIEIKSFKTSMDPDLQTLNLKTLIEGTWNVIKSEIENNSQWLANDLSELKELIENFNDESEQKKVLEVEKRCKRLEAENDFVGRMVAALKDEREKLTKDNQLLNEKASKNLTDGLQGKVNRVMDLLNEHIETNEVNSAKLLVNQDNLLMNQDNLFKMLKESLAPVEEDGTSCADAEDGYEVVEEF